MGRKITINTRVGGGSADEVVIGEALLEPTSMHKVGAATVFPAPTKVAIINGAAEFPDVEPSPAGPLPEWCYKLVVRDARSGRAWSKPVGVPAGTGALTYNDLTLFEAVPANAGPSFVDLVGEAVEAKEGAAESATSAASSLVLAQQSATAAAASAQLVGAPAGAAVDVAIKPGGAANTSLRTAITAGTSTVSAASYGVAGNGVTDDTAKLQAALDATLEGQRLIIPQGTYKLTAELTLTGRSIIIEGYGATLVAAGNHGVLNMNGAYGAVHAVTGTSPTTVTSGGEAVWTTAISLSSTPNLQRGDVVKIYSEDIIEGSRPGSGGKDSRRGEFAVVDSIVSSTVTVMGRLRETYSTNVRLAKMENHAVHIRGLRLTASLSTATATLVGLIRMTGPTMDDVIIERAGGAGVTVVGCYGYTIRNLSVLNLSNDPVAGQFGYGVLDNSSSYGRIIGLNARHVRHAYSDDSSRIVTNSNPDHYGRTYGAQIIDSVAHGATVTGWDTHHAAENVHFINCQAINCYAGFALRGRKHIIRNGFVRGGKNAINIFTEAAGCESWGHDVTNVTAEGMQETPVNVYLNSHNSVRETRSSTLRDLRIDSPNYLNSAIRSQNGTLELWDIRIVSPAELPASATVISGQNSAFVGGGITVDLTANTSGTPIAVIDTSANGMVLLERIRLRNTSAAAARSQMIRNTVGDIVKLRGVDVDYPPATSASTSTGDIVFDYVVASDGRSSSSFQQGTYDVSTRVRRSLEPVIVANIQATGTNPTLAPLPVARREAQMLRIVNIGTVGLIIPHGTATKTDLDGDANKTLAPQKAITLVWNGTSWLEAA